MEVGWGVGECVQVSWLENVSMGDLAPPFIRHMVVWVEERCPPLPLLLVTCDRWESSP